MSNIEAVAVTVSSVMLGLCCLVVVALRGTSPRQRPAILRALGDMLRGVRPSNRLPSSAAGSDHRATPPGGRSVDRFAPASTRRSGKRPLPANRDRER